MEMQELEINISPSGEVKIEVKGAHGDSCLMITRDLENALGQVEDRQYKAEFYEQNEQNNQQWNQGT
ncbi:MAG: hypothetical protein JWM80_1320 [Cyanobacteria bacterium RYN_339]|nr:hypothetical protein [Cyanobacteria bacterium RYN_339]